MFSIPHIRGIVRMLRFRVRKALFTFQFHPPWFASRTPKMLFLCTIYVSIAWVIYIYCIFNLKGLFGNNAYDKYSRTAAAQRLAYQLPFVRELDCNVFLAPKGDNWTEEQENLSKIVPQDEVFHYHDCHALKAQGFQIPTSKMEDEFPVAFSILVYNNLHRFTRLLRAVYRSSNVYCVHVDQKSSDEFKEAVSRVTKCFDNVIEPPDPLEVYWGSRAVLLAEIVCLQALWKMKVHWLAFINLTGEEFPLKTNLELVHILRLMNGINDVWVDPCTYNGPGDWTDKSCAFLTTDGFRERWKYLPSAPFEIKPYKGQIHVILFRNTVDYILHSAVASKLLEWINSTFIPDELFFSTLNSNTHLGVPGSNPDPRVARPSIARLKLWIYRHSHIWQDCDTYLRSVCLLSPKELPLMMSTTQLFANKFKPDHRPMGYSCLEQFYFERVLKELSSNNLDIDLTPYHLLLHVHNREVRVKIKQGGK